MCREMKKLYYRAGQFNIDSMLVWHLVNEYSMTIVDNAIKEYENTNLTIPDYGEYTAYVFYQYVELNYKRRIEWVKTEFIKWRRERDERQMA